MIFILVRFIILYAGMAAVFCHEIRAAQLILTHFSQRYERSNSEPDSGQETVDKLVQEAKDTISKLQSVTIDADSTSIDVSAADDFRVYTILAKK